MAGSARYTVILDANVLYPSLLRDTLMSLATAGLYHARWTNQIHEEWTRNLAKNRPDIAHKLADVVRVMNRAVPDCLVENYEGLVPSIVLPDQDDRHVVAAAIAGHADAIVSFNVDDFPLAELAKYNIEIQHPDTFLLNQIHLHKIGCLSAIKRMRERWKNPEFSAIKLVEILDAHGLPFSADELKEAVDLI
ncbi:PIN domain-containing protein [Ottowia sp. VDI28]|uniref:PIN domain-containing protein n=1 Tax=Ottowia sp. VDI28 TaxID=3133968 RepID=UPI003C2BBCB0